jgi:hypothetical protein
VFPLAEPFANVPEPLSKESQVVRHGLPGPQKFEDLKGNFRHIAKMPVDDLHVCEPGVERNEMVVCVPRSFRIASRVLSPQLHDPLMRVRPGVRKEL